MERQAKIRNHRVSNRLFRLMATRRLVAARLRSWRFAWMGASVGSKCLFGSNVRIDRPWTASFGQRCVLEPSVWFDVVDDQARVSIGAFVFIGRGAHFFVSDGVTIGDHTLIGDGVVISDHKHDIVSGKRIGEQGCTSAPIRIGADVLICVRAFVLQGVTVGDGAVIGPGAVVTHDVPPNAIVGAAPGRVIGTRSEDTRPGNV